jgi:hypothetical protein
LQDLLLLLGRLKVVNLKSQIRITILLGLLTLISGVFAHLALTDIYHLESDVNLEWNIVRACAFFVVLFIATALLTLGRTKRIIPD